MTNSTDKTLPDINDAALDQATAISKLNQQTFEERQFLKILIDTIPSPIFYKDKDGVYRHCNEAFSKQILGLDKEQIINRSLFDLPDEIPADLAQIHHEKDKMLFDKPGTQTYKGQVKCYDGQRRTFQFFKSTVVSESGEVAGLVGIMLDITSMEMSQEKLSAINTRLESLSSIDALTGVYNRRKFDEIFPDLLDAPLSPERILNLAFIDIDHFKLYNDVYGHPEGDKTLKLIADTIVNNLRRPDDNVFRMGGEEFCLLFYSHNAADALAKLEAIRADVEGREVEHARNEASGVVTISAGLLSIQTTSMGVDEAYEMADQLMYQAKHSGRNRISHKTL